MSNNIVREGNTTTQAHLTCLFELNLALQEYEISVYSHKMNPNYVSHYQYMMGPTCTSMHVTSSDKYGLTATQVMQYVSFKFIQCQ